MAKKKIAKKTPQKSPSKKKRKLRIAQMHWGYPPIIGGVETHLALMLPEMARYGHEVHLLTGSVEGCKVHYLDRGVHIRRTPLMDLNWLFKRGLHGLEEEIEHRFTQYIQNTRPDVMHVHNMHYFSREHTEILETLCKTKGIPLVLTAHNVWDDVLYLEMAHNIGWDHIIAVSHFIRKELIGIGLPDAKVTTIHHGVDTNVFHPKVDTRRAYRDYPQLRDKQIIFHPARMGMAKGCDVSIKAFNIIHKHFPDAMLVLAGTKNIIDWGSTQQKDIAYFVNLIRYFKLEKRIMVDSYALDQMPGLYGVADVVIYPSTAQEPFGLTMLEAMATAKPMVVTRAGGMPEIISDGINGFVIPPKDFEELAGVIMRLLGDAELRQRFGNTGKRMVDASYTKEVMTQNNIDIYEQLLR